MTYFDVFQVFAHLGQPFSRCGQHYACAVSFYKLLARASGKSRATTFLFFVVLCCVNCQDDGRRARGDGLRNRLQEGAANYGPKK